MTDIHGSGDCGNSPKNRFVQDVAVALETGQAMPEGFFSNDVVWEGVSEAPIEGLSAIAKALAAKTKPIAIAIEHAISHGKVGAASGEVTFANGQKRRFSHVLEFTNTKANCVAVIKSYS